MKVKYADQEVFCTVTEEVGSGDSLVSTNLEEFFPTLGAEDAILIKRVTVHPSFMSTIFTNPV